LLHLWFFGGLAGGCEAKVRIVRIEWSAYTLDSVHGT
jgi:hypothetical protein